LEQLAPLGNDVGLYAEEIRPQDGAAAGNFPLALTHVAHLNARLTRGCGSRARSVLSPA
jgi:GH15 family glucan-1,4-alpha-glucosidase